MIHGTGFSDDDSATVSSIASLGLVGLKGKTQKNKTADGTRWSGFESNFLAAQQGEAVAGGGSGQMDAESVCVRTPFFFWVS